jgi:hypothetical protein
MLLSAAQEVATQKDAERALMAANEANPQGFMAQLASELANEHRPVPARYCY